MECPGRTSIPSTGCDGSSSEPEVVAVYRPQPQPQPQPSRPLSPALFPRVPVFPGGLGGRLAPPTWRSWSDNRQEFYHARARAIDQRAALSPPDPIFPAAIAVPRIARVAPSEPLRARQPQIAIAALLPQADFPWTGITVARVAPPEPARGRVLWPVTPAVVPPDPAYDFAFRPTARVAPP